MNAIRSAVVERLNALVAGTEEGLRITDANVSSVVCDFAGTPRDMARDNFYEIFRKTLVDLAMFDDEDWEPRFTFSFGDVLLDIGVKEVGEEHCEGHDILVTVRVHGSTRSSTATEGYDWDVIARETFEFCEESVNCKSCAGKLASQDEPAFGICDHCRHCYNKDGCRVCHGQFGRLFDGKHKWCE